MSIASDSRAVTPGVDPSTHARPAARPSQKTESTAKLGGTLPIADRVTNLIVILVPFAALIGAVVYAWGWGIGWLELALFFGMYLVTGLGVTVGYHRYFTHKSFECGPITKTVLGIAGSMSVEGSIFRWVAFHRAHHQHSDHEQDPHSPHGHGSGVWGVIKGAYNAHVGWMLKTSDKGLERYVTDLKQDRLTRTISDLFPLWMVLSLIIPAVIGGLVSMSWGGALLGFVWGGLIRVLFVHHATWSVNSVCHLWGTRAFKSHDESRNNAIVGVLALGEGWHNNHHAFPTSARHGLKWWQFDASWIVIQAMHKLGLAWKIRVPPAERLESKRV